TDAAFNDVTLEIAAGAVGTTELAADAVTTNEILDGTIASGDIAADAVNAATINADVAGSGLTQNGSGALEVDVSSLAGDGDITSSDLTVTGGTDAAFNDVTLEIADDAVNAATINADVAGSGLTQNGSGALEVDVSSLTGDGDITSSDLTVTGGTDAAFNDVTLEIAVGAVGTTELAADAVTTNEILDGTIASGDIAADAVNAATINADVAGSGLTQNGSGALEVDVSSLTGDGDITSSDLTVTGGTDAAFNDVTLEIAAGAVGTTELAADAVTTNEILDGTIASGDIAADAVNAATINADVAGSGLTQNGSGALEVDVSSLAGDGDITSSDLTVTGGTDAAFNDVTLEIAAGAVGTTELAADAVTTNEILDGTIASGDIAADAVNAATINADVAGSGLIQNGSGALEVDVSSLTGDGDITSSDLTVTGGTDAAFNDVTLEIADDAVNAATINADVAGSGLIQNGSGALEVDVSSLAGDGDITSTDSTIDITGGTDAAFTDVTLDVADDAITTDKIAAGAVESSDIAADAVNAATINADVAGSGLIQNGSGALEVDVSSLTGDGDITSSDLTVTGGTDAAFNDVTLEIADDAVNAATINADVAGSGLIQNGSGALEVDVSSLAGDGDITSTDSTIDITGGTDAAFTDVTLDVADDAITTDKIAAGAVESSDIAANAVTLEKIVDGTASGQVIQWDGTDWTLVDLGSVTVTENDGVIGNEVTGATDGTLTLSGAGTTLSPLTLGVSTGGITSNEIAADAVNAATINADVAGSGLTQNGSGALEVDVSSLAGDGDITSSDLTVTGGTDAAFNDVTLEIADDAVNAATINADVAGSGL
ncbi:hypothetical protein, partial [Allomuricauda sp. d1]|uniref:beta strand repeat-containing protein n=1 Tax=Allomuricauda sp. d1 TaxID=3136725 RepID=UPI0031E3E760